MEKLGYILITGFFILITCLTLQVIEEFYPEGLIILLIYERYKFNLLLGL